METSFLSTQFIQKIDMLHAPKVLLATAVVTLTLIQPKKAHANVDSRSVAYVEIVTVSKAPNAFGRQLESQGTGFRFGPSWRLVTSNHLLSSLEPYDPAQTKIYVRYGSPDAPRREAIITAKDPSKDILILKTRKPEITVPRLYSPENISLKSNETQVCVSGYPAGYDYTTRCGFIESLDGPFQTGLSYLHTTDFTFGPGMSGSPVYLKGTDSVIGVAKGRENSSEVTVGYVVPISYALAHLPKSVLSEQSDSTNQSIKADNKSSAVVVFETKELVETTIEEKERSFHHRNNHCERPQTLTWTISAAEGTIIDVDSVKLVSARSSSRSNDPQIISVTETTITLSATAVNKGECIRAFSGIVARDGRGSVGAKVEYSLLKPIYEVVEKEVLVELPPGATKEIKLPETGSNPRLVVRGNTSGIEQLKVGDISSNGWGLNKQGETIAVSR